MANCFDMFSPNYIRFFSVFWLILGGGCCILAMDCDSPNDRPIIGVLAQFPYEDPRQYIAASYVKYVESSGARVVPIFIGHPQNYYAETLKKINGLLLPGGGSPLNEGPYADSFKMIMDIVLELNEKGIHFPVWASCLSFEMLIVYTLGNSNLTWQSLCHVSNLSLNLEIEQDVLEHPKSTQLFKNKDMIMPNIIEILQEHNVTANYHRVCIEVDEWEKHSELTDNFTLISHNKFENHTFVSTIEHKIYPIFASIWHPEKNQFEFVINSHTGNINHDLYAIMASQYFANVFIEESRKNCQHFENKLVESQNLIYNFNEFKEYTGSDPKSSYEEVYRFPERYNGAVSIKPLLMKSNQGAFLTILMTMPITFMSFFFMK